jgi:CRP-like cAMP-binding protein
VRPITRDNFAHVIAEHPETSLKVMRQLARRLAESDDKIVV